MIESFGATSYLANFDWCLGKMVNGTTHHFDLTYLANVVD